MRQLLFILFISILAFTLSSCSKNESNDKNKPFIVLNGNSFINWPKGTDFVDPGAIVYDITETNDTIDISNRLQTSGEPNVDLVGLYEIKYNADDEAGNSADEKQRSVRVLITK